LGYAKIILLSSTSPLLIIAIYNLHTNSGNLPYKDEEILSFLALHIAKARRSRWGIIIGGDLNSRLEDEDLDSDNQSAARRRDNACMTFLTARILSMTGFAPTQTTQATRTTHQAQSQYRALTMSTVRTTFLITSAQSTCSEHRNSALTTSLLESIHALNHRSTKICAKNKQPQRKTQEKESLLFQC
jgi:hypothetical protein